MIKDIEKIYQDNILLYKSDKSANYDKLVDSIYKLDNEYTVEYLNKLKEFAKKSSGIHEERVRIDKVYSLMKDRLEVRNKMLDDMNILEIDVSLKEIPNIDKIDSFSKKLEIFDRYFELINSLNNDNKNDVIEELRKSQYRKLLLEFSLIDSDNDQKIIDYVFSLLNDDYVSEKKVNDREVIEKDDKLKILKDYYDNLNYFPNLKVPNMGLIKDNNKLDLDNNSFFIK